MRLPLSLVLVSILIVDAVQAIPVAKKALDRVLEGNAAKNLVHLDDEPCSTDTAISTSTVPTTIATTEVNYATESLTTTVFSTITSISMTTATSTTTSLSTVTQTTSSTVVDIVTELSLFTQTSMNTKVDTSTQLETQIEKSTITDITTTTTTDMSTELSTTTEVNMNPNSVVTEVTTTTASSVATTYTVATNGCGQSYIYVGCAGTGTPAQVSANQLTAKLAQTFAVQSGCTQPFPNLGNDPVVYIGATGADYVTFREACLAAGYTPYCHNANYNAPNGPTRYAC
ncbi:hypothetical protein BC940DRAFT_333662 [Gongronella butleri]|nr:hypothetical protein BC940DRAFT_333662 [Gongronella butleri]